MPRRMIDPEIWTNERFGGLELTGRLLFIGIFSHADDDGRVKASISYLKAKIFPYDNVSLDSIEKHLQLCHELRLVRLYTINGARYLTLPNWTKHQFIRKDRYRPSKIPNPNTDSNQVATQQQPKVNQVATTGLRSLGKVRVSIDTNKESSSGIYDTIEDKHPKKTAAADKELKNISKLYEDNIGQITPMTAEVLKDITKEYPAGWFGDAVKEAVANNVRRLNYITAILEQWKRDGRGVKGGKDRRDTKQEATTEELKASVGKPLD